MKRRLLVTALLVSIFTMGVVGCFRANLDGVDKRLLWELRDASVDKKLKFKVGPLTMSVLKAVTAFAPVEPEVKGIVRGISSVDIAIYELANTEDVVLSGSLSSSVVGQLSRKGWEPIVKAKDKGSLAFVFCRYDECRINGIYVIAMEENELVLVKVRGRLEQVFALAMEMAERPGSILQIHHD